MFITKEIMNSKLKKSLLPHKKQILKEIKASHDDQVWEIDNFYTQPRPKSGKKRQKRPNTAITIKSSARKSTSAQSRPITQQNQHQNTNYLKKVNYQFDQISKIANLFDNKFDCKEKKLRKQSLLSQKVNGIKRVIREKQKEQKQHYDKMKRVLTAKVTQTQPNIYMGYSEQKVHKIIPVSTAKHQDMTMLTRYIKGGYVSQAQQYSEKQNKAQVIKLKKRFLTMSTLYDAVKGKRNEGIDHVKPQSIDRNSLQNYVYYLQNQKTLKLQDKLAIQQKIKMVA